MCARGSFTVCAPPGLGSKVAADSDEVQAQAASSQGRGSGREQKRLTAGCLQPARAPRPRPVSVLEFPAHRRIRMRRCQVANAGPMEAAAAGDCPPCVSAHLAGRPAGGFPAAARPWDGPSVAAARLGRPPSRAAARVAIAQPACVRLRAGPGPCWEVFPAQISCAVRGEEAAAVCGNRLPAGGAVTATCLAPVGGTIGADGAAGRSSVGGGDLRSGPGARRADPLAPRSPPVAVSPCPSVRPSVVI